MNVIHQGTTEQVVEMLDTFKASLPKPDSSPQIPHKNAAPEKPANVPLSLSHVPGSAPSVDPLAALAEASGEAQLAGVSSMNAAQLDALMRAAQSAALNRLLKYLHPSTARLSTTVFGSSKNSV